MARSKAVLRQKKPLRELVATVGLLIMVVGGMAGAYLGYRSGGLGAGFVGLLLGGAVGFGIVYVIANLIRQNSKFFTLVAALLALGLVVWGLHVLGDSLGLNPK